MQPNEIIELYVVDTVRLLPGGQREDVAAELRSLLNEELQSRVRETGRPADEALTLELVRGYGHPKDVAARYQPAWTLIDPADSRSFLRAAIIGAGSLVLLSVLSYVRPNPPKTAENLIVIGSLAWFGFLGIVFGVKNWMYRRWPALGLWKPRERGRVNRIGVAFVVPVAFFVMVLYAAPGWVLDSLSGGRIDTSWAVYSEEFQRTRLPLLIGLMFGLVAMLTLAAIQGRWVRLTRRIDLGINMALALLLLSMAVGGPIFESATVDKIAKDIVALIAAVYVMMVGAILYGEIGRLDPDTKSNQGHPTGQKTPSPINA